MNITVRFFAKIIIVSLLTFVCFVHAEDENKLTTVDHRNKLLVINDTSYKMPITMQVYIMDAVTKKPRKVNRYALKSGQVVYIKSEIKDRQRYMQRIIISQY